METVLRALGIYLFLTLVVRISGRRTLGEMTIFDFVLVLIIAEATQQGLLGDDFSVINAWILIATFVLTDGLLALLKQRSKTFEKIIDGIPSVIMRDGVVDKKKLEHSKIDEDDILEAARKQHGIGTLADIRHAVLERDGGISIIPKRYNQRT